jgi:4-amino-4-deoxy-L-arabinose transferase-like glycosyltransferase
MGLNDSSSVAENVERGHSPAPGAREFTGSARRCKLIVILVASLVFLLSAISPPSLMDDVDAVQAQIARNMITSGDWVTARLDGVAYLEKSPLVYWMMACSFEVFGVHDWAARLPIAISAILLCWLTTRFAMWAMGVKAGFYAGLIIATCAGLFLFTRILIPDVILTLTITLAMFGFMRAIEPDETNGRWWAYACWTAIGVGLLLKGLIAAVFPVATAILYLLISRRLFVRDTWQRLCIPIGICIVLAIAAPWHILATLRNPPYWDLTMHSESGSYRGFFWFYFFNEHILRFLNLRYPRDYNTVPRLYFWLFHLLWLFPWSVYFPAVLGQKFRAADRASRVRLLALCWIGIILVFFSFSTTQEYYSMPCYPALAILLGSAMAGSSRVRLMVGTRAVAAIASIALVAMVVILFKTSGLSTPGDISVALNQHPDLYTLSLGHMLDLTWSAFAYLRLPLLVAGVAVLIGAAGAWLWSGQRAYLALAAMMIIFVQAAHLALNVFDPYLGSRALAEALNRAPRGKLIVDDQYYTFSSIFFYTDRTALLLNGRVNNLEYGSYAPGAPDVFIDDSKLVQLWKGSDRYYLAAEGPQKKRLERLVGARALRVVAESGGKYLFVNQK